MALTGGSFALEFTGGPMINGDLAAFPVHFSGKREGAEMSMSGIDVLRIEDGKIAEMWLFSADQGAEDAFWGRAEQTPMAASAVQVAIGFGREGGAAAGVSSGAVLLRGHGDS